MSYYRRVSRRPKPANNNRASRQGSSGYRLPLHDCEHCNILELDINRQEEMLAEKKGHIEEMRELIDWLQRDITKANLRICKMEGGTDSDDEGTEEDGNSQGEPYAKEQDMMAETLETLREKEGSLNDLTTRLDKIETEIEGLQRQNQSLYEESWEFQLINKDYEKELKINKEVDVEMLEKLKRLAVENEDLKYKRTLLRAETGTVITSDKGLQGILNQLLM